MQRFLTTNHFAGSDREQLNWLMGFSRLNMRPVAARNSRGSCLNFPIQGRSRPRTKLNESVKKLTSMALASALVV